jgi:arginase
MHRSHIAIIGAPLDLGSDRRGVDMGPSAMRVANINKRVASLGYEVEDLGNVPVDQPESLPEGPRLAKYLPQIAALCTRLGTMVERVADDDKAPLVLGGDHSIAIGTVAGMSRHFRKKKKRMGLLWVDAHADMNTPQTSPSGNIHGMPLACCIGMGPDELSNLFGFSPKVQPKNVALVGLRDVDILERPHVRPRRSCVYHA